MDVKEEITKQLDSLYNFATTVEVFDNVTLFGIGKKIQEVRITKKKKDKELSEQLLLDTLVESFELEHQVIARPILKNELNWLSMSEENGDTYIAGKPGLKPWIMGLATRVIKQILIMRDIVGIQPMQGPVGLVYSMQYKHKIPDNFDKDISSDIESRTPICLEAVSSSVEARSRSLQASFTLELMQDIKHSHTSINFEEEILQIISQEIAQEIIYEIIDDLITLATKNPHTRHTKMVKSSDKQSNMKLLYADFNYNANRIADATRRGPANTITTTPLGTSIIIDICKQVGMNFVAVREAQGPSVLIHMGDILGANDKVVYSVYSTLAPALQSPIESNEVKLLFGYKGRSGEIDVGYIYAPYVPVMTSGLVINELTFQPMIKFITRHGKWTKWYRNETELEIKEQSNLLGQSSDYYNILTIPANILI